jgi:phosphoglycerol transferase MdoB-like AlkP superfamily enzyme
MVMNPVTTGTEEEIKEQENSDVDTSPNVLTIDMDVLLASEDENIEKLANIMQAITPSNRNEYTGMFEGYNLIYLTAEAFAPYAVSEELTPTLYKMIHEGVVVEDYYVPLWATSTSDGEYVNLTGQIPDEQYSMKRTQNNAQPYSLPAYFAAEGVKSFGYHNNTLSYYDRHLTHPNLGYDFKAARLGSCSADTYGGQIFEMEGAAYWPASDYEMMAATIPEWISEERFHAYYMTVSGHAIYTREGNMMTSKNWDVVKDLDCSEEMKGYIASNYELEKAMTYLVEELEKAGKLDNTVIALSADHYPYGIEDSVIEEFYGRELEDFERYKNCVIIWNNQMEPIQVQKTCSAIDLLPTLLNLFGFEYDSRLFPGKDMLSDSPSLVVFSNRSFITDSVIYDAKERKIVSRTGEDISEEYVKNMKDYVKILFQYSAGILNDDFFRYVDEADGGNTSTQK